MQKYTWGIMDPQDSWQDNPMDVGVWWAIVHGVKEVDTT